MTSDPNQPHLKRVLGRFDLVLLFVVAVFNLNVVPSIAANGGVTVWLWIISLLLFFWPQGIAVIELAHRYPGEGGVYLWAKEVFGDFHGFLSGWCYWTNNMLYVPTVMLYFVGVTVFAMGQGHAALADNKNFAMAASLALLVVLTIVNIVGLGVGKWLNNLGAIGTFIAAAVLIGLGFTVWSRFGTTVTASDFRIPADPRFVLNSFGVICFGLVGARTCFGDGRRDSGSAENFARRGGLGGHSFGSPLYRGDFDTAGCGRQERHQRAAGNCAGGQPYGWQSWRGVDRYSVRLDVESVDCRDRICVDGGIGAYSVCRGPRFLYAVLAGKSASQICDSVCGAGCAGDRFTCADRHQFLCFGWGTGSFPDDAVAGGSSAKLVPFLYVFAALLKFAFRGDMAGARYRRGTLIVAGFCGFVTTALGIVLAFFRLSRLLRSGSMRRRCLGSHCFFWCWLRFSFLCMGG